MTARDTLPADPGLLAARPPNPAATAQPGWRGTDSDGGTWVRLDREDLWFEILAAGRGSYRSQEEAEAAGLVPLRDYETYIEDSLKASGAPAPLDPRQVATAEELDALPDSAVVVDADGGSWQRNGHIDCVAMWDRSGESERWTSGEIPLPAVVVWIPGAAAPAPLDPGNPEHPEIVTAGDLRWFAGVLHSRAGNWGCLDASHPVVAAIRAYADRLDRERAEAKQDAEDRAEADNYAKESSTTEEYWARHNAYLDGIRAERARQEVGQ